MWGKLQGIFAVLFLSSALNAINILVKIPTRQRPDLFFKCLDLYYAHLSGKHSVQFLITCDADDLMMNNVSVKSRLQRYANLKVVYGHSNSKIDAYNRDIQSANQFDVLVLTSDDTIPVASEYDDIIAQEMIRYFPDFGGVLRFNDGVTPMSSPLNTLPIIGRKFYERFGYAYHPDYKSFFCDLELSLVSRILGKEAAIDKLLFKHDHPTQTGERDALFDKNYVHWYPDLAKFKERAVLNFDLQGLSKRQCSTLAQSVKMCLAYL